MNKRVTQFLALVIFFSCIVVLVAFKTGLLEKDQSDEPDASDSLREEPVQKERTMMSTSKSTRLIQNEGPDNPMHLTLDSAPPPKADTITSVPAKRGMGAMYSSKSMVIMPQGILKKPDSLKSSQDSILP